MGIWKKLKYYAKMMTTDPNSPAGLRIRAKRLIDKEGYKPNNPYISFLCKQILMNEGREDEFTKQPLTTTQIINILEEKEGKTG